MSVTNKFQFPYLPGYASSPHILPPRAIDVDKASMAQLVFEDDCVDFYHTLRFVGLNVDWQFVKHKTNPNRMEIFTIMARNSKNSGGKKGDWRFANVPFGKDDVAAFLKWKDTQAGDVWYENLEELVQSGRKMSISYNNQSDKFTATISCYDESDPDYRSSLTSHAPSATEAMLLALYKHFVMCEGAWFTDEPDLLDAYG